MYDNYIKTNVVWKKTQGYAEDIVLMSRSSNWSEKLIIAGLNINPAKTALVAFT